MKLNKYDLKNGITQSMLNCLNCPYKLHLVCNGITKGKESFPLYFGSMFHECLEHCHKENNFKQAYIKKVINNFIKKEKTSLEGNDIEKASLFCLILLPYYNEFYKDDFEVYSLEKEFDVPLYNSLLRGKIDGIIKFKNNNAYTLFEHKTKSRIDTDVLEYLEMNFQVLFYTVCAEKLFNIEINSVLYNIIRTPGIRQGQKETFSDYAMRLNTDIQKRKEHYFIRHNTTISKDIKKRFKYDLMKILRQAERALNSPYKNMLECFKGFKCQYLDWCSGRREEYTQENLFQELNVNEKKGESK